MDDRTDGSTDHSTPEQSPQGESRHTQREVQADAQRDARQEGFAAAHAAEQNRLLAALPLEEYARLLPQLTPVRLGLKQVLVEPDAPIRDVYFPRDGVCSVIAVEQEGGPIEVGTVGREGFVFDDADVHAGSNWSSGSRTVKWSWACSTCGTCSERYS